MITGACDPLSTPRPLGPLHRLHEIAALVDRDQVDPEEGPQPGEVGGAGIAGMFAGSHGHLFEQAVLDGLANLHRHLRTHQQDLLDRRREPPIAGALQEGGGDEEQEDDRNKGQPDVGEHQLGAEPAAEDAAAPLEHELENVADEDEGEDEDQRDVEVPQDEKQQPVGELVGRHALGPLEQVERARRQRHQGQAPR